MPAILTNDGVSLNYQLHGTSGPVIVLVHGWSASGLYFLDQVEALSAACRVVVYDQRGHGDSDKPGHGLHIARLAVDLRELLVQLHLDEVTVVGTSMGCAVIWSYIELFAAEKLRRAVFVDQAPLQNRKLDWQLGSKGCYDAETLANLQSALVKDMSAFADGNLEGCTTLPLQPEVAAVLKAETLKCVPEQLGELMADHTQLDWRPLLARISMPCLTVIGCKSAIFPVAGCEAVSSLVPDCKTAYFKASNHWLYLEEAGKFNALLLRFVLDKEKELKDIARDHGSGVTVRVLGDNVHKLHGTITGPKDSPYEGGSFLIDIDLRDSYPYEPPKMKFITKVWHPNISSQTGAICLDILKDQWSPALGIKTALLSLQILLEAPQPDDPQDAVVAKQYMTEFPVFQRQAKAWTEQYANNSAEEQKVKDIMEMGFTRDHARRALDNCGGDKQAALDHILSTM